MRIGVVGGSLGGLTAALVLGDLGHDVEVFERSAAELVQRGAGIGFLPESQRYLVERADISLDSISVSTHRIRYFDRASRVIHDESHEYRFSSWNTVYRNLLRCLPAGRYRLGHEMTGWEDRGDAVEITFSNGSATLVDLAVFADGVNSLARSRLLPEVAPRYAGYVAWRGMVPERDLDSATRSALSDAISYFVHANSHILVYPIPGLDGEVDEGSRLINFVWYRNYSSDGGDLDDLLTDRSGRRHDVSLPPGAPADHHLAEMRAVAMARLPGVIAEVVTRTEQPFLQVVFDLDVPAMAFDRTCLIGDAAFLARPHAAAGTAKAADDAWALGAAIEHVDDDVSRLPNALAEWEKGRLTLGRQLLERTRAIGRRSQVDNNWIAGDPDLIFGLRGPGQ